MAKYKRNDSAILSGKIGGLVYKQNANGAYLQPYRKKVARPVNSQQYINQFTTLASHWRTLTEVEQFSWEAARFQFPKHKRDGTIKYLTRKQLFMSTNAILMQWCGYNIDTILKTAPTPAPVIAIGSLNLIAASFSLATLQINASFLNGTPNVPPNQKLVLSASMPWTGAYPFVPSLGATHFMTLNSGALLGGTNLFADYGATFVPLKGGETIYLTAFCVHELTGSITSTETIKIFVQN